MRHICIVMVCIGILAVSVSAHAQEWFVSPAGSDDPNGSPEQPFETIQQALGQAQDGDTIILMPGVYTGPGNYDLHVSGLSLTIRSSEPDNWDIVESTVIDPDYAGGVFIFTDSARITLEGLTIQNAWKRPRPPSEPYEPPYYDIPHGAAISADNVHIDIRYCVFNDCYAELGGAIEFYASEAMVSHSIFAGNGGLYGGALISDSGSSVTLEHCTLVGNTAGIHGGGASCEYASTLSITNSILWGNESSFGYQLYAYHNSVISVEYSVVDGGADGTDKHDPDSNIDLAESVIDTDPLLAAYDLAVDPSGWDLRLQSSFGRWDPTVEEWVLDDQTSPGIVAGPTTADYSREPWPNGRRANIGAYGNTAQASLFGNIADLNADGRVDMIDLAMLAAVWMGDPIDYEDLTLDGMVYLDDLLVIADNWLWELP